MEMNFTALKDQVEEFKRTRDHSRQGYPPDIKNQIKELLSKGHKVSDLVREIGVSHDSIVNWTQKRKYTKKQFTEVRLKNDDATIEVVFEKSGQAIKLSLSSEQHLFLARLIHAL